jgi:divalent metal cation (Fe/Co/Zn/Cd) transporter
MSKINIGVLDIISLIIAVGSVVIYCFKIPYRDSYVIAGLSIFIIYWSIKLFWTDSLILDEIQQAQEENSKEKAN